MELSCQPVPRREQLHLQSPLLFLGWEEPPAWQDFASFIRLLNRPGYLKAVWPEFVGSVFGVWAAPGGFKNHPTMWGAKPPTFLDGFKAPGAAQTPQTTDSQSNHQTNRLNPNPSAAELRRGFEGPAKTCSSRRFSGPGASTGSKRGPPIGLNTLFLDGGSLAGILWIGFWGLGGPLKL